MKVELKVAQQDAARAEAESVRLKTAAQDALSKATADETTMTRAHTSLKEQVAKQKTADENAHAAKLKAESAVRALSDSDQLIQEQEEVKKQKLAAEKQIEEEHNQAQRHVASSELQLLEATSAHELVDGIEQKQAEVAAQSKVAPLSCPVCTYPLCRVILCCV